jgi:TATA-box binding protein (TBP) (component of TFIID and TFIIIB)
MSAGKAAPREPPNKREVPFTLPWRRAVERADAAAGRPPVHFVNVVSCGRLVADTRNGPDWDVAAEPLCEVLTAWLPCAHWNPALFSAMKVRFRLDDLRATALLFWLLSFVIPGFRNAAQALRAAQALVLLVNAVLRLEDERVAGRPLPAGATRRVRMRDWAVTNVVACVCALANHPTDSNIDLAAYQAEAPLARWRPEKFPGLTHKASRADLEEAGVDVSRAERGVSFVLFDGAGSATGARVNILGARDPYTAWQAYRLFLEPRVMRHSVAALSYNADQRKALLQNRAVATEERRAMRAALPRGLDIDVDELDELGRDALDDALDGALYDDGADAGPEVEIGALYDDDVVEEEYEDEDEDDAGDLPPRYEFEYDDGALARELEAALDAA